MYDSYKVSYNSVQKKKKKKKKQFEGTYMLKF